MRSRPASPRSRAAGCATWSTCAIANSLPWRRWRCAARWPGRAGCSAPCEAAWTCAATVRPRPIRAACAGAWWSSARARMRLRRCGEPSAACSPRGRRSQGEVRPVALQPALVLPVPRAAFLQQLPEARRVVRDVEVAHLVPHHRLEHGRGGEEQPPVEAHAPRRRARRPARALPANRQPAQLVAGRVAGPLAARLDLRPRAPAVPALECRDMVARRYQQCVAAPGDPLAPGVGAQLERLPEGGDEPL